MTSPAVIPPESERQFMAAVVDMAKRLGWAVWHQYDSRHSAAGWPDLFLLRPPRALAIECKTERGRVSGAQKACLALLALCGIEVHVFRPSQKQEIAAVLR